MKSGFKRQAAGMIDICHTSCSYGYPGGDYISAFHRANPPPLRRTHRRTKRPARFHSTPTTGPGTPGDDSAALQLLDVVLSDPERFGSVILIQSDHCSATSSDIV